MIIKYTLIYPEKSVFLNSAEYKYNVALEFD